MKQEGAPIFQACLFLIKVCSNGSRVFVQRSIIEEFTEELVKATNKLVIGDPFDHRTQVGATISKAHAEKVLAYIYNAVDEVCLNSFSLNILITW